MAPIYDADTTDVEESGSFEVVPAGSHAVFIKQVTDKITKANDPMISVWYEIASGDLEGRLLFDNIVIPKAGSPAFKIMGRTKHFLHVIGQPYEGKFKVIPENWVHEKLIVKVEHEIQKEGKNKGKPVAVVAYHDFFGKDSGPDPDVPFD